MIFIAFIQSSSVYVYDDIELLILAKIALVLININFIKEKLC